MPLLDAGNVKDEKVMKLEQLIALKGINLNIKQGEFVCIIGDVGSGKSSLLSALIGDLLYLDSNFVNQSQSFTDSDYKMKQLIRDTS